MTASSWIYGAALVILLGSLVVTVMQWRRLRDGPPKGGADDAGAPPAAHDQPAEPPISPDDAR